MDVRVPAKGEWQLQLWRRWPFGKLRLRWVFEYDLDVTAGLVRRGDTVTLEFPGRPGSGAPLHVLTPWT